jgi:hypothetical protein
MAAINHDRVMDYDPGVGAADADGAALAAVKRYAPETTALESPYFGNETSAVNDSSSSGSM